MRKAVQQQICVVKGEMAQHLLNVESRAKCGGWDICAPSSKAKDTRSRGKLGPMQASNQLAGALEYLGKIGSDPVDRKDLEEASGVGVEVTHEQLAAAVKQVIESEAETLREER